MGGGGRGTGLRVDTPPERRQDWQHWQAPLASEAGPHMVWGLRRGGAVNWLCRTAWVSAARVLQIPISASGGTAKAPWAWFTASLLFSARIKSSAGGEVGGATTALSAYGEGAAGGSQFELGDRC